jgi:hypothetical protein
MKKEMQVIQSCLPVVVGRWKEVTYEPNIAQSYVAMNLTIDLSLRIRYSFKDISRVGLKLGEC